MDTLGPQRLDAGIETWVVLLHEQDVRLDYLAITISRGSLPHIEMEQTSKQSTMYASVNN